MGSAEWAPKRFHNGTRSFLPPSLQLISEQTQALLSSPRSTPYSPRGLFPGLIGSISYRTTFQVHCFIQTFVSSHSSWNPYLVLEKVRSSVKQKPPPFDFLYSRSLSVSNLLSLLSPWRKGVPSSGTPTSLDTLTQLWISENYSFLRWTSKTSVPPFLHP